jgi:hypothetical protein
MNVTKLAPFVIFIDLLIIFTVFPVNAQQTVITFDDLPNSAGGANVPNGYQGLNWNNFGYLNGRSNNYNPSGYPYSVISPNNVSFNWSGTQASISSPLLPFDFDSAYLTAAWCDALHVQVLGYVGGVQTYSNIYTLSATNPTLINFNYRGVDIIVFNSSGGTPHPGYSASGEQFAMDSVTIVTNPPASNTILADNFATDTNLNTTLWATWSSILNSIAAFGEGGCSGNTLVEPTLSFGPGGMLISGANNNYEFTGIQSLAAFSPPFTLNAVVTGTIANGNPFELFLSNSNWTSRLAIFGNINSANCGYYGIWANEVNDGFCAVDPYLLYQDAAVGVPYTIQVSVDATGVLTVSLINNGILLAQASGSDYIGPFYVILGQGEGAPCTGASTNVAVWQYVGLASSNSPPAILAQPESLTVGGGATAIFSVTAIGTPSLDYQWQRNRANLSNNGNANGITTATLIISNVAVSDLGSYQVVVSNAFGSVTSSIVTLVEGQEIDIIPATNVLVAVSLTNNANATYPTYQLDAALISDNLWGLSSSRGQVTMNYFPSMGLLTNTIALEQMNMTGGVAGYPEIQYGFSPNSGNPSSPTTNMIFPMKLGDLASMETLGGFWSVVSYAVTPVPPSNPIDFTYDIWITPSNAPTAISSMTVELMIWLYANSLTPIGNTPRISGLPLPCLVNGQQEYLLFNVYASTTPGTNGVTVSLVLESPVNAGLIGVDLSRIVSLLGSELQGWYNSPVWTQSSLSDYYVLDVELGSEFKGDSKFAADYEWAVSRYYFVVPPIPVALSFGSTQFVATSGFEFSFQGPIGSNYVIQASSNLVNWQPITNVVSRSSPIYVNDSAAKNFKQRFYRAVMQ